MNHKITLLSILIFSIILSVVGFLLDNSEHQSGVMFSIFEIVAMAALLFIFITVNFFAIVFCVRQVGKLIVKSRKSEKP